MKNAPATAGCPAQKQHIVWFDTVRLIAMVLLVCCHSADPFNFYAGNGQSLVDHQFIGALWGSAMRPCVPLFVMLTGALLLPMRQETGAFYRRRISRVLWPFLIWSVLYNLFPPFLALLGCDSSSIITFFSYAGETPMTMSYAAQKIAEIPLNFTAVACHQWYIYLLIGLYLYLPVFSAWVEKATERAKLYFLLAWGVTLLLPYYRYFVSPYVFGTCSWNDFGMLYYFAGFNGYLLLGHYLRHHTTSLRLTLLCGIPLFAVGYLITFYGFTNMRALPDSTETMMELFFTYNSINVVMMTIPLFMIAPHIRITNTRITRLLANLTVCGFGIYMAHYFLIGPCFVLVNSLHIPLLLQIPLSGILAFSLTWLFVWIMKSCLGKTASRIALGV